MNLISLSISTSTLCDQQEDSNDKTKAVHCQGQGWVYIRQGSVEMNGVGLGFQTTGLDHYN